MSSPRAEQPRTIDSGRADKLSQALMRAEAGDGEPLFTLLRRHSKLPGPKPNLVFAEEVTAALAGDVGKAHKIAAMLLAHHPGIAPGGTESEYLPVVGLHVAAGAVLGLPAPARRARDPHLERVLEWVHEASDDLRFFVRDASVLALGQLLVRHEEVVWRASAEFIDGFFPAATFIRALGDRSVTDAVTDVDAVLEVLKQSLELLLNANRSDVRYPGYKELLAAAPRAWTLLAGRFGPPVLETLLPAARSREPRVYNLAAAVAGEVQIRGRYPEAVKRLEAARNELPRRIDPRNERLKKRRRS